MEENNLVPAVQPAPASSSKKRLYNKPWFIILLIAGGLLLLSLPAILLMMNSSAPSGSAADAFYKMVETTAQKTKIHYAYALSIPEGAQFSVEVKSLTEYDAVNGEYSTAYVSDALSATAGRCVKGVEYESTDDDTYPDDFKAAERVLNGPFKVRDKQMKLGVCDFIKPRYQGDISDGILAIGLKSEQAKSMTDALKEKAPVKLGDEGKVEYKGKSARKVSFEVGKAATGTSYQSDVFFYSFRDGMSRKVGANVPLDDLEKHFDNSYQVPAVGLKGYYLIDEITHLPLYRYMETVADGGDVAEFVHKTIVGEYEFPDVLTMDEKTKLPEIVKQ